MTDTSKIIVLTDLHLRAGGKTIIGLDPTARFLAAYTAALRDHGDAEALVIMGDLTHSGRAEEFAILHDTLRTCPLPVLLMLGNHDDRPAFRAAFPDHPVTGTGHVQQIMDLPHHRLITLDSHEASPDPLHSGWLCEARLAWLDEALSGAGDRMPLVFVHHPPFKTGLPGMDAIRLMSGDALLDRLRPSGAHLFCGHIHRTISGQASGVPFTMFKSTCHQAPLDLHDADCTLSIAEPGAYGLLWLTPDGVVAHSADVGFDTVASSSTDALPEG